MLILMDALFPSSITIQRFIPILGYNMNIGEAINYIEENITEEIAIKNIAKKVLMSPFYFQKGFAMLCGFTVGKYIRQCRLTLAGSELVSTDKKIIILH